MNISDSAVKIFKLTENRSFGMMDLDIICAIEKELTALCGEETLSAYKEGLAHGHEDALSIIEPLERRARCEALEEAARTVEIHQVGECPQPCGCEGKAKRIRENLFGLTIRTDATLKLGEFRIEKEKK